MRRGGLLALVFPLLAGPLAGCLQNDAGTGEAGTGEQWLFTADGEGLRPAPTTPSIGRTEKGPRTVYDFDLISLVQPDQAFLALVQALGPVDGELDADKDITIQGQRVGLGEDGSGADFCLFEMGEVDVPGEGYIERAKGRDIVIPDPEYGERQFVWSRMGGSSSVLVSSYGVGGGFSLRFSLEPAQWLLLGAAQSGVSPTEFNDGENQWAARLEVNGPIRVILLPAPMFLCGVGLARFGGTHTPMSHSGGALAVEGVYGTTADFSANELPVDVLANEATLRFLDQEIPLSSLSHEWHFSYQPGVAALDVSQWTGQPSWMLAGLSIPVPAPGCPDACPPG